jgi:hypothetical protein
VTATNIGLSWPADASGFLPQSTLSLIGSPTWTSAPGTPTIEGGPNKLTLPVPCRAAYYWLQKYAETRASGGTRPSAAPLRRGKAMAAIV